jgi:predicted tellurium resistance membrane protein TerC
MHDWSADLTALLSVEGLIGLLTLSVLEIILGIDNIIFISIAVNRLPHAQQKTARTIGLALALIVRSILLLFIGWIAGLKDALFNVGPYGVSGKSIILIGGGIFLLIKTWQEIMEKIHTVEGESTDHHHRLYLQLRQHTRRSWGERRCAHHDRGRDHQHDPHDAFQRLRGGVHQ